MTSRTFIASSIACATLLTVALIAQDNPPQAPPGSMDLTGIPVPRGIYYHASDEWVTLSSKVLMPIWERKSAALEILNVGSDHTIAEMPGSHAGVQIGNDVRPTFYLHGISPADVYLVRFETKANHRELRMAISGNFREGAYFRAKDVTDVEIRGVNGDVVAIRPSADLKPGEYALASVYQPGDRWIRLGFDFGILGSITGQ
jgi:hypothetical protein